MERRLDYASYTKKQAGLTMDEIIRSEQEMLSMAQISRVMGMHPSRLNEYARTGQLMFPVQKSGNRYKVPRRAFLAWMGVKA